jgi:hypothetical protein
VSDWTVAVNVGRLVEGRPVALRTRADAVSYCAEFRRLVPPLRRVVVCADYRAVAVFPPDVANELARLMTDMNPYIERSGVLVAAEHATGALQVQRFVREAHLDDRRRFTDANEMLDWLGEVLTTGERERAAKFLASM